MPLGISLSPHPVIPASPLAQAVQATIPSQLNLAAWVQEIGGALPWVGVASAGVSGDGSHNLIHDASLTDPTAGTALNGHAVATFNGVTNSVKHTGAQNTYLPSRSLFCGWAVIKPTDRGGTMTVYHGQGGGAGYMISLATGTGVASITLNNDGASTATRAFGFGAFKVLAWRWDGVNVQIGVNEVPGASGGASSVPYVTDEGTIATTAIVGGAVVTPAQPFQGDMADYAVSPVRLSDADFTMVVAYLRARYAI